MLLRPPTANLLSIRTLLQSVTPKLSPSSITKVLLSNSPHHHQHIHNHNHTTTMAPTSTTSNAARPIVISGPSGAGKSTILKRLFADFPGAFGFSISNTTRKPRGSEKNGVEYHFCTRPEFEALIEEDGFIEYAEFSGNYYGTSKKAIKDVAEAGKVCVLDIEMEGVKQILKTDLGARCMFLAPPSLEVLEERLRGRGTDKEEDVKKRLEKARVEMEFSKTPGVFDLVVVNDDLEKAYGEVKAWVEEGTK